jgi:hypothetical protein
MWGFLCFANNWWLPFTQIAFIIALVCFMMIIRQTIFLIVEPSTIPDHVMLTIQWTYYAIIILMTLGYQITNMGLINAQAQTYGSWLQYNHTRNVYNETSNMTYPVTTTIIAKEDQGCYDP